MEPHDQNEGGMKKKVATGVAVGLATTAAAGVVAKKLLGKDDGDDSPVESGAVERGKQAESTATRSAGTASRRTTGSKRGTSTSSPRKAAAASRSSRSSREPTKEQLYARAKRLEIPGRSSMTKAQLERAIARAK
jgi:hypothetical protein